MKPVITAALLLGLALHAPAQDLLLGAFHELHLTESVTAAPVTPGVVQGMGFTAEIAVDEAGRIFAASTGDLYEVTLDPPGLTAIGNLGLGAVSTHVRELAFHPDGTLWALVRRLVPHGSTFLESRNLWTIDTTTAESTFVVDVTDTSLQSLAIAGDGTFYSVGPQQGLVTIDPGTGQVSVPLGSGFQDIQWLDFDACGVLHGGRESLVAFDLATGDRTLVGTVGYDVRGGAFLPQPPFADTQQGGLAGTAGQPLLSASGDLLPLAATSVTVTQGDPGSSAFLVIGFTPGSTPFLGGTLVPSLDVVAGPFVLDGAGELSFSFRWPDVPPCTRSWWQAWVMDAGGPQGWSASDALVSQSAP